MIYASLIVLGLIGFALGLGLSLAHKKLAVPVDPREKEILGVLPGVNCGACGLPGCSGYAEGIVHANLPVNKCTVGGAEVAEKIAAIMGVEAGSSVRRTAFVLCQGNNETCPSRYNYRGIKDCRAANLVAAGHKSCTYGCLGLGTCVSVCPFSAIMMGADGLPVVDMNRCTACGKCVEVCPRSIMKIMPFEAPVAALCSNRDKGGSIRKLCKLGCTGCTACVKACPEGAITMNNNLPVIDYKKCKACGACAEKCPTGAMVMLASRI